jgi:heme oxygenase
MANTLIAELRRATATLHSAVEALPGMGVLTSPTVTRADYLAYLRGMARACGALEPPLLAVLDRELADLQDLRPAYRPRLPALVADCLAEGVEPPAPAASQLVLPGLSEAMGGLYVLEGATLGGRVIARHLRRHLPDGLGTAAFLDFHGDAGPAAWRSFTAALERLEERGLITRVPVIAGARTMFQEFHRILADRAPCDQ